MPRFVRLVRGSTVEDWCLCRGVNTDQTGPINSLGERSVLCCIALVGVAPV